MMPDTFLYFQFCGFIVALAAKYKHSVCRCPRLACNIEYSEAKTRFALAPSLALSLPCVSLASEIFHFSRSNFYELFTYLLESDAPFRAGLERREIAVRENA